MFENKEYVYAVYTEKSFSKAAQKLYISQPCLSAMIKKTEKKLGVPLFQRNTRTLHLTEYGEKYIRYIEQIMKIEGEMQQYLDDIQGIRSGHISVGANNVCTSFVLPQMIRKFSETYSDIEIVLSEGNRSYLEEQLKNGRLDLVMDNYPVDLNIYEQVPIFKERLFFACPPDMAEHFAWFYTADDIICKRYLHQDAASKEDTLPQILLKEHSWIIVKKGNDTRNKFEVLCEKYHLAVKRLFEVDQLTTAYHMAVGGLGLTVVSDTLIRNLSDASKRIYYPFPAELAEREMYFHFLKNEYQSMALKQFIIDCCAFHSIF